MLVMIGLSIVLAIPYVMLRKKGGSSKGPQQPIAASFAQIIQQSKKKQVGGVCENTWWGCGDDAGGLQLAGLGGVGRMLLHVAYVLDLSMNKWRLSMSIGGSSGSSLEVRIISQMHARFLQGRHFAICRALTLHQSCKEYKCAQACKACVTDPRLVCPFTACRAVMLHKQHSYLHWTPTLTPYVSCNF